MLCILQRYRVEWYMLLSYHNVLSCIPLPSQLVSLQGLPALGRSDRRAGPALSGLHRPTGDVNHAV